ncbi:hypothetical protein ACHAXT_008822 [Thalassiosira profunda]
MRRDVQRFFAQRSVVDRRCNCNRGGRRLDGFTVAKYQQFWDLEMADEDEAIVEWAPKLPSVAKAQVSEEALLERWPQGHDGEEEEEEEDEVVEVAKVSPDNKRKAKKSAKQPAKKRKTAKVVAADKCLQDTPLLKRRDEWFALLNAGGHQFFTLEKAKKSDGIHKMKERAERATEAFAANSGKVEGAKNFHKEKLDVLNQRIKREIEAEIHAQMAKEMMVRRKEIYEAFCMVGYVSASDVAAPVADGGSASEDEAAKKDATTDEEGAADEDKESLSDAAADDLVEDVLA